MSLDQQGYFWFSNPWIASSAIVAAIGVVVWCHQLLGGEDLEQLAVTPVRVRTTLPTPGPGAASGDASLRCQPAGGRARHDAQSRRVA
jgi:hypothetical protein